MQIQNSNTKSEVQDTNTTHDTNDNIQHTRINANATYNIQITRYRYKPKYISQERKQNTSPNTTTHVEHKIQNTKYKCRMQNMNTTYKLQHTNTHAKYKPKAITNPTYNIQYTKHEMQLQLHIQV